MKVLLIQPPIEDFYDTAIRTYPLGLLYVAARVGAIAETIVFDARTGKGSTPLPAHGFPELTPYYRERAITPFSFFDRYRRFGLSLSEISARIAKEKPDLVGIAAMCSAYERQALEVAEAAKAVNTDIVTVVGGIHPTLFPARVLGNGSVDYCIRGEGETPFFELVAALSKGATAAPGGIGGVCFKNGGRLHLSEANVEKEIDLLPARQLVEADRYRIGRKRYAFLLTSRGCPFSCGFCGKPPAPYRKRRLESIEQEMDACAMLGIEAIDFEDDMLNLDRDYFAGILKIMTGRGLTLSAMNGIYPGNMDVPLLRLMYDAGFRRLNFSLVDVSESVLRTQKRQQQRSFLRLLPFLEDLPFSRGGPFHHRPARSGPGQSARHDALPHGQKGAPRAERLLSGARKPPPQQPGRPWGRGPLPIHAVERHAPLQPALPEKRNLHVRQTRPVRQLCEAGSRRRRHSEEDERSSRG